MLNKKQKKLLKLLAINARYSNKDLGKALKLSSEAVQYNINSLQHLFDYSIHFDYWNLGYKEYHYLVRLKTLNCSLTQLKKLPYISFINTSYGAYDLQIILTTKTHPEKELEEINNTLGNNRQDDLLLQAIHSYKYISSLPELPKVTPLKNQKNKTYKLNKENFAPYKLTNNQLDNTDKKLIQALLKSPRASYQSLQNTTNIPRETIRRRLHEYIETNFLKAITIQFNYAKFGYYINFLLIKTTITKDFLNYIQNDNIFYVAKLLGQYDVILYIITKDPNEFGQLQKEIRNHLHVKDIKLLFFDNYVKSIQFPETEFLQ